MNHLFPIHEQVAWLCGRNTEFKNFTLNELRKACDTLKNKRTSGPRNISLEIVKYVTTNKPVYTLETYNLLARRAEFPKERKQVKLVEKDSPSHMLPVYEPV